MKHKKLSSQKSQNKKNSKSKMKRGFKACQFCNSEMHIHQKVCKQCNNENTFVKKENQTQNKSSAIDVFKKINDTQISRKCNNQSIDKKIKKVPQKIFARIHVLKKSFLYDNQSNMDEKLITSLKLEDINEILFSDISNFKLPKKEIFVDQQKIESGQFHKLTQGKGVLFYFGCPILSIAIKKGIILVSLQVNQYQNQAFSELHLYGKKYNGKGVLAAVQEQKIQYFVHREGAILQVKFSYSSTNQIGSINANGSFTTLSLSNTNKDLVIKCLINIPNQILSCFDWCPSKDSIVAIGDQEGNVYLIKIKENKYDIINYLEQFHLGIVKDLQFYFHNDNGSPLLLTGGYDGYIKIINPKESKEIFCKHITSKGITQVKWDKGGKFILCINDDPNQRAIMFCFFTTIKKEQNQVLQNVEKRLIQPLTGDDETTRCASNYFHDTFYFASQKGIVFGADLEQIRKQAIKKEKKQTYQSKVIHSGQINLQNGNISYQTRKVEINSLPETQLYDWSEGYHFMEVDEMGNLVVGNLLGVLIIL